MPETVGIVGLGLIGGSIGLALREPGRRVIGYDPNPKAANTARDRMCVDVIGSLEDAASADVVFVAVPPDATVETVERTMALVREDAVVTDCASVKSEVAEWAQRTKAGRFVPGHPMAGHEKGGAEYASAWMFRGARWIVTPVKATQISAVRTVEHVVKAMGAVPIRIDAAAHDRHVATVSHLPHVLAAALVLMGESLESADMTGGSWRDMTRVGGVDPELWTQIMMRNRKELAMLVGECESRLAGIRGMLERDDRESLKTVLREAERIKAAQTPTPETRTLKRGRR